MLHLKRHWTMEDSPQIPIAAEKKNLQPLPFSMDTQ